MVKYLKGRNAPINDLEGGANVDSDCENYSANVSGGRSKEKNEETRAVLITGSFSAYVRFLVYPRSERNDEFFRWRSLFFYRCTDTILFAPLRSQGSSSKGRKKRKGVTARPAFPLCSPKSVYVLANLVRRPSIKRLRYEANASGQA